MRMIKDCMHQMSLFAVHDTALRRLESHASLSSGNLPEHRHPMAGSCRPAQTSMGMHSPCQQARLDPLFSGRRYVATYAADAAQSGTAADMQEVQDSTNSSQETARVAQALVSEASKQQRKGDVAANREGMALLLAAATVWAAAHRDAMLMALARISLPDAAAVLLAAAALLRLMPARARAGAAHFTALLQSVFLLGSIAYDIAEVKKDIKQVQAAMQGLYARAAWVPPKLTEQERQRQRQQRRQQRKRDTQWGGVGAV